MGFVDRCRWRILTKSGVPMTVPKIVSEIVFAYKKLKMQPCLTQGALFGKLHPLVALAKSKGINLRSQSSLNWAKQEYGGLYINDLLDGLNNRSIYNYSGVRHGKILRKVLGFK